MKSLTAEALAPHAKRDLGPFAKVEAWIFDLDNTLYPRSANIFHQVDQRIRAYVGRLLNVDEAEAERIQKDFYRVHGTTLRGLMLTHNVDPDEFLEFVHDIDHSAVQPDPALGAAILRLPGKKYIFTNGSRQHAEKVAERLGFSEHFEDIFDIVAANLVPKPHQETYDRFFSRFGMAPENSAMFEDLARNLIVPKSVGMTTVLVVPPGTREVFHGEWEYEGRDDDQVDFVTDDLARFVAEVADAISAGSPECREARSGTPR
jgi:putative hydrolase of the HAD superfamily